MPTAEGSAKSGAMLTRREYLCDASFLVALQGETSLIARLKEAIENPRWTLYLGRKCCPPSRPLLEQSPGDYPDLVAALISVPWSRRLKGDDAPGAVECLIDWVATPQQPEAPGSALVWYDIPVTFDPPAHNPRFVIRKELQVGSNGEVRIADKPRQSPTPNPPRPRADYTNSVYKARRLERLDLDHNLCVFCKSPGTTVQHITYRHAGGDERIEELRTLCRLCHDAVTMIEYGLDMGLDRINPEELRWREQIRKQRAEIIKFRSLKTRRRKLAAKEVE